MPSDFERSLMERLRDAIPDLQAECAVDGKGKSWLVNLYSKQQKLVIEGSSRAVKRHGRRNQGIQHIEKFHSMALKLIDIKSQDPTSKPVMIWRDLIPASSNDLKLCSAWGIYVLSHRDLRINEVLRGKPPAEVNKLALKFLIRRSGEVKPRWAWLRDEQREQIVANLRSRAMTSKELCELLGLDFGKTSLLRLHDLMRSLCSEGAVLKLLPGFAHGHGAVFGTDPTQLISLEPKLLAAYGEEKRKSRLAEWVLWLISEEPGLTHADVARRLQERWKIVAERHEVVGILHRNLARKGLIRAEMNRGKFQFYATELGRRTDPFGRRLDSSAS